jgi:mannose-1-phosphate guanylyltransferase
MRVAGKSLIQRTLERASAIAGVSPCAIVANTGYLHQLKDELAGLSTARVLLPLELSQPNTAPAIAVAALIVRLADHYRRPG